MTGRIFSTIVFAPISYICDFSFSVRLRKLSNSAICLFTLSVSSSICSSFLSFFFLKKDFFLSGSSESASEASASAFSAVSAVSSVDVTFSSSLVSEAFSSVEDSIASSNTFSSISDIYEPPFYVCSLSLFKIPSKEFFKVFRLSITFS